jgi:outer membrane protein TolC
LVQSAQAAREYAGESLEAERQRFRLGDSTTADVLQMQRGLAIADDNVISAKAAYARDRAALYQVTASTLERYGIRLVTATAGALEQPPAIPGLTKAE